MLEYLHTTNEATFKLDVPAKKGLLFSCFVLFKFCILIFCDSLLFNELTGARRFSSCCLRTVFSLQTLELLYKARTSFLPCCAMLTLLFFRAGWMWFECYAKYTGFKTILLPGPGEDFSDVLERRGLDGESSTSRSATLLSSTTT